MKPNVRVPLLHRLPWIQAMIRMVIERKTSLQLMKRWLGEPRRRIVPS